MLNNSTCYPPEYIAEIGHTLPILSAVENGHRWIQKLDSVIQAQPRSLHRDLKAVLFELKIMSYLLSNYDCRRMSYEPTGHNPQGPRVDIERSMQTHCGE